MDIKDLKRDMASIEGGAWVDDIPQMGELRLRVRGSGYKEYTALLARLTRSVPREERDARGNLTQEAAIRVMAEAMHAKILLEWDGLTDDKVPVPYDKELALQWMTDPETRPFLDAVVYAAQVVENGRAAADEMMSGN